MGAGIEVVFNREGRRGRPICTWMQGRLRVHTVQSPPHPHSAARPLLIGTTVVGDPTVTPMTASVSHAPHYRSDLERSACNEVQPTDSGHQHRIAVPRGRPH